MAHDVFNCDSMFHRVSAASMQRPSTCISASPMRAVREPCMNRACIGES